MMKRNLMQPETAHTIVKKMLLEIRSYFDFHYFLFVASLLLPRPHAKSYAEEEAAATEGGGAVHA
jgi:hypothetical protein